MPYTMEDFRKDFVMNNLNILSPDDVLQRYSPNDRLKGLSPDDVLKKYSLDDRLKGLSAKEIKEYLKRIEKTL